MGCPEVPASERPPTVMYGRVSPGAGTPIDAAQGALRMAHRGPLMMINYTERGAEVAKILRRNRRIFDDHMTCTQFFNSIQLLLLDDFIEDCMHNSPSCLRCVHAMPLPFATAACAAVSAPSASKLKASSTCHRQSSLVIDASFDESTSAKKIPLRQQGWSAIS